MHKRTKQLQVLVFRTSLQLPSSVEEVKSKLFSSNQIYRSSVDLEDWEKVLRIECDRTLKRQTVIKLLNSMGYDCQELE